jgi:hypothetical protein
MNPVLALTLVAVVGLLVTRLPRLPAPRTLALVLAGGTPLVLLGLLLGPGIDALDGPTLSALAPVTALAVGWIGAGFGARCEWRLVRRLPRRVAGLLLGQAAAAFVAVALGAWAFTRWVPALTAAWVPRWPAVLTLAAVAAASGPDAIALVARARGVRRSVARTLGRAALLDTACGALAFTLALAVYHPRQPGGGVLLGWASWLARAGGAGVMVGLVFVSLARLMPQRDDFGFALLAVLLLGAGLGWAADLSPFVVCALAGALIVNVSPSRRRVQASLAAWEQHTYAVVLISAGALLTLPTLWIAVAVPVLAALRVAAKWGAVRWGLAHARAAGLPPPPVDWGLATVAQGGIALALGVNFFLTYAGAPRGTSSAVVTTIVLGVVLAQGVALPLLGRALAVPRLTPRPRATELSADSSAD